MFQIFNYNEYSELPFEKFHQAKFSIYIIDFNWNYLFVNKFVELNLKEKGIGLIGKNIWDEFPELSLDPDFKKMKQNMEKRRVTNLITTSSITGQRLSIVGHPLKDCYYFSSSILLNKADLINDLRNQLDKL